MSTERLKRKQVEERYAAVLKFYIANPTATGDEAQDALVSGRMTGQKGPPMNIGQLYRLRRQALQLSLSGAVQQTPPTDARTGMKTDGAVKELRALAASMQKLMDAAGLVELHLTRSTVKAVRNERREDAL
jgi:hypothetical protein